MKSKFVKEALNESDFDLWSDDDEDDGHGNRTDAEDFSHQLEIIFQEGAEVGLNFEMMQQMAANALDKVDYAAAGQM